MKPGSSVSICVGSLFSRFRVFTRVLDSYICSSNSMRDTIASLDDAVKLGSTERPKNYTQLL